MVAGRWVWWQEEQSKQYACSRTSDSCLQPCGRQIIEKMFITSVIRGHRSAMHAKMLGSALGRANLAHQLSYFSVTSLINFFVTSYNPYTAPNIAKGLSNCF